jgi:large subunit ribosomal protein L7/L12
MRYGFNCAVVTMGLLAASSLAAAADEDSQKGEQVLPANQGTIDTPLRRHPKSPWYELSNLRKEGAFGEVALDFRREGDERGWHEIVMVVKGVNGRHEYRSVGVSPFAQAQGSVRGQSWFGSRPGDQLEVWFEQHLNLGAKPIRMKVSKSISMGDIGQPTLAREWTAEEKQSFANLEKAAKPPPAPPSGYQVVEDDTKLLPGMPVLAGLMAEWQPAEVIDVRDDRRLLVKYSKNDRMLIVRPRSWVAVEAKTLAAGVANPGQFRPSAKVLPGGSAAVPADWIALDKDTPIVKGVPVKADWHGSWQDATVLDVRPSGKLRIRWDKFGKHWDEDRDRSKLLITPETQTALKAPDAAEKFADRAETVANPFDTESRGLSLPRHVKNYPISMPIPKIAERVTDETPLETGTRLGCSWGRQWYVVTVMDVDDDGAVKVHWDKFGDAWDDYVSRDSLIVEKKVLAKLRAKSKSAPKTDSVARTTAATSPAADDATSTEGAFKVVLKEVGSQKIPVIKAVMDVTGLDLKDAKEFVESAPITIKQNLNKSAAEKLRGQLQDAGATVAIELQ